LSTEALLSTWRPGTSSSALRIAETSPLAIAAASR
jgi:hypothetical protein